MESWSYFSGGGKGFVSEESVSVGAARCIKLPPCTGSEERQAYRESSSVDDGISLEKNRVNGWELNTPCSWRNSIGWSSTQERGKDQDFAEMGCQDLMRKSLSNNQISDAMSNKLGGQRAFVSIRVPHNAFSGEDESSSVVESNCKESSLIDLKLGSFKSPNIIPNLSSTVPAKRNRAGGLSSHTQFCQVQGCGKDLSSCKDYHKRHKVCEVHSKTAKVIVNGIEQRFCQQCSRFHLLAEFDDGKRSCRKRLADHNERRRKPQTGLHSGRAGRVFQSYAGTRFQGTPFATSSFICEDILGSGLLHQPKHDMHDWYKNVKVEHSADYSPQLTMPFTNGHSQPRSLFSTSYHTDKHPSALHDEGITAITRSKNNESSNSYLNDIEGSDFVSRSLFHNTSIGSEVLNVMDSASNFQGISNSCCALSLLSSQSQDSSNYSSLVPNAHHLITLSSNTHYNVTQTSEKFPGVNLKDSTSNASSIFNLSGGVSAEDRMEQVLRNNCGINVSIHGSDYVNTKNLLSCEDGPTIDLLQLSSQLHRVEHQRHFMK